MMVWTQTGIVYKGELQSFAERYRSDIDFGQLPELDDFEAEREEFSKCAATIDACLKIAVPALHRINEYFPDADLVSDKGVKETADWCNVCREKFYGLNNWRQFSVLLGQMNSVNGLMRFVDECIAEKIDAAELADAYEKRCVYRWINEIEQSSPILSTFGRVQHDQIVREFQKTDKDQFKINQAFIRQRLSQNRPISDCLLPKSPAGILRIESKKHRKRKNVRTLLAETGDFIQKVKPCFMMSPLSVSTFLDPQHTHFDVVIFDEASQIFPEDAIGAIYRAKQLIVAGDDRQMPPTSFFKTIIESDDDEDYELISDCDSILDACSSVLPQLSLLWHYRSRHEQLIAFSNKNFYHNRLVTFPSPKNNAPDVGVNYHHVDGIYDRRSHTNRAEALHVVDLIYRHIQWHPDRSLGIICFNERQQDLIDLLLAKRRQNNPDKEFFFADDVEEPFFIKNLETVQGDERDTIIFSTTYGRDSSGRLLQNFGPLIRKGGERRLNVAVTRAKINVQVVSSMHAQDIDLKNSESEGTRLLREYLDFAENGEQALDRTVAVSESDKFESPFEEDVCDYLRSEGYSVDSQVGCSGFRIDLALKRPESSDYVLAIECDGASYHSGRNARDRDRLRQEILEGMGWRFYRIWSTDWFNNRAIEQQHLLQAVRDALAKAADDDEAENNVEDSAGNAGIAGPKQEQSFENAVSPEEETLFPEYRLADMDAILQQSGLCSDYAKRVLEVESPILKKTLLKRMLPYFKKEKVTAAVRRMFDEKMAVCEDVRDNDGFLYLEGKPIEFRVPGDDEDTKRDVREIAPEELAAGMLEIIRQNTRVNKTDLYRDIISLCGSTRMTKQISEHLDKAFAVLGDEIVVKDDEIFLNKSALRDA